MDTAAHKPPQRSAGRPRTSHLARSEQLRLAKRRERERERKAGVAIARLKLPIPLMKRLVFAARQEGFEAALKAFLEAETIEVARYQQLKLLAWNRRGGFISACEAWDLYERNWRLVEPAQLDAQEQELLHRLVRRFGGGVMNV